MKPETGGGSDNGAHNIVAAFGSLQGVSQLQQLRIQEAVSERDLPPDNTELPFLRDLAGFRHLRSVTLTVYAVVAATVRLIATIPTLTFLQAGYVVENPGTVSYLDGGMRSQCSRTTTSYKLRVVRLNGYSQGLLAVLAGLHAPELRSLRLKILNIVPGPHLLDFIEGVATTVNPDVVRHISIEFHDWSPLAGPPMPLTSVLRPLISGSFHALRHFELASPDAALDTSDAELACVLGDCGWTQLEEFRLHGSLCNAASPSILRLFRVTFPSLRVLVLPSLSIDSGDDLEAHLNAGHNAPERHPLRTLRIGSDDSWDMPDHTDIVQLAHYIHGLFPLLEVGAGYSSSRSAAWRCVFRNLYQTPETTPSPY